MSMRTLSSVLQGKTRQTKCLKGRLKACHRWQEIQGNRSQSIKKALVGFRQSKSKLKIVIALMGRRLKAYLKWVRSLKDRSLMSCTPLSQPRARTNRNHPQMRAMIKLTANQTRYRLRGLLGWDKLTNLLTLSSLEFHLTNRLHRTSAHR